MRGNGIQALPSGEAAALGFAFRASNRAVPFQVYI